MTDEQETDLVRRVMTRCPSVAEATNLTRVRARSLVPDADFIRADAMAVDFPPASFDAVVCLFALIHLPLAGQEAFPEDDSGHALFWARLGGGSSS